MFTPWILVLEPFCCRSLGNRGRIVSRPMLPLEWPNKIGEPQPKAPSARLIEYRPKGQALFSHRNLFRV